MAPRYSLAGNAGLNVQSGYGRSSAIGVKKEMNDKNVQQQTQKDLVDFCMSQGYPRSDQLVRQNAFPLNSTDFRMVFTFLVRFLEPDFQDFEPRTFHEKALQVFQDSLHKKNHISYKRVKKWFSSKQQIILRFGKKFNF